MLLKVNALFISQMYTIQLHSYAIVVLQSRVTTAFFQTVMLQFYMHLTVQEYKIIASEDGLGIIH